MELLSTFDLQILLKTILNFNELFKTNANAKKGGNPDYMNRCRTFSSSLLNQSCNSMGIRLLM